MTDIPIIEAEIEPIKPDTVLYLCDRKACDNCSYPLCNHTTDISHIGKRRKEIYMTEGVKETACTSCIHRVVCSRMREYLGIIKEIDSCTYCSEDEDNVVAIISKVDWIVMQYPLCKYYLREQKTTGLQNICNSDSDYAQFAEGV